MTPDHPTPAIEGATGFPTHDAPGLVIVAVVDQHIAAVLWGAVDRFALSGRWGGIRKGTHQRLYINLVVIDRTARFSRRITDRLLFDRLINRVRRVARR